MTWNYQIIKEKGLYRIHEVIGKDSWTEDECAPYGETRDELRQCITNYINDISKLPILIVEDGKIIGEEEPLTELLKHEGL